jgi:thiol-disulfide isomerase/thioredoxin
MPALTRSQFATATLLLLAAALSGCNRTDKVTPNEPLVQAESADSKVAAASEATLDPAIKLDILTFDEIQQRVASHKGKVVVVDAWSTSCPPCMKEFHNLVELHKKYGPEKVACISLSFDYEGLGKPEEVTEPVLKFLRAQGATFDNLMSSEESDALYQKFKLNAVPAVFVYGRDGVLRERFDNEGAYAKALPLIEQLVNETPPANEVTTATETPAVSDAPPAP